MKRAIYNEVQRPQIHYSPRINWMNDPNGCIYHKGIYHLYYQYHPFSLIWGPMHWGHAVSTDLFKWEELPVALYPDEICGTAFSGSAVIDADNSCGLFDGEGGIAVLYTGHKSSDGVQLQHQCLAVSTDDGNTLIPYMHNPVIPSSGRSDFRDPKVFFHGETRSWVMIVSAGMSLEIYRSPDLKAWQLSSSFTLEGLASRRMYECPDLIRVPVSGGDGEPVWMLSVSLVKDTVTSAGVTVYTFGSFDGYRFIPDEEVRTFDHGYDFYAVQSWSNLDNDRAVVIGWINHWGYAHVTPTAPWRGCMSIPRELSAEKAADGSLRLMQRPVLEMGLYREESRLLLPEDIHQPFAIQSGTAHEIMLRGISPGAEPLEISLSNPGGENVIVRIDSGRLLLTVDRQRTSCNQFDEEFASVIEAAVPPFSGTLEVMVIVDRSVLEVFAADGEVVMTNLFFSSQEIDSLTVSGDPGPGVKIRVTPIRSIWESKKSEIDHPVLQDDK